VLLLDTHIWYWYVQADAVRFSRRIQPLIERAVLRDEVAVSVISVWEIAQLAAANRIDLEMDVRVWAAQALAFPGLRLKALSPSIAIESTHLPGEIHRDPADRILIATARLSGSSIVTGDERILQYAKRGYVRAVDARS
jgi:PIN domain nuclease of toxin-antitoxin system